MSDYTNKIYEQLKALHEKSDTGRRKDVLKTIPVNNYIVRIVPDPTDISKIMQQYYTHGWKDSSTGKYVYTLCPSTYGEDCPICKERFRLWDIGSKEAQDASKKFARKERYYSNVYVVDDPVTPENNDTVKIFGYGRQISKIINEALFGDDKEEFGARIIDFSKEGVNLRIKVEKNMADFPTYERSKFLSPSKVGITVEDAIEQSHDFEPLLVRKPIEDIQAMLDNAMGGATPVAQAETPSAAPVAEKAEELPMDFPAKDEKPVEPVDPDDFMKDLENITE